MSNEKITTVGEALASARVDGYSLRLVQEDEDEDKPGREPTKDIVRKPIETKQKAREVIVDNKPNDKLDIPFRVPSGKWKDRNFCIEAIRISQSDKTLRYIPYSFWCDRDFCLDVIRVYEPDVIGYWDDTPMDYIHRPLWKDDEFCLAAARLNGEALEYVQKEKLTLQLYLAALEQDAMALKYVPAKMQTEEMIFDAIHRNGRAIQYASKWLLTRPMVEAALAQKVGAFSCLPPEWQDDYREERK